MCVEPNVAAGILNQDTTFRDVRGPRQPPSKGSVPLAPVPDAEVGWNKEVSYPGMLAQNDRRDS